MVVQACYPNTSEWELGDLCKFEASLIYIVSSRPPRVIQLKHCQTKRKKKLKMCVNEAYFKMNHYNECHVRIYNRVKHILLILRFILQWQ